MSGGQASTLGQGVVGLGLTLALVGSSVAVGSGTIVGGSHGQVITISQGTLTAVSSGTAALSGSASTSAAGTIAPKNTPPALTGQVVTGAQGTVTAQGNSLTVNITGEDLTLSTGFVSGGSQFITGSASTSAQGTAVPSMTFALSGQAATCGVGSVSPDQSAVDTRIDSGQGSTVGSMAVALSGTSLTSASGTLTVTADSNIALTGSASTVDAGSIGIEEAYPLTGSSMTASQQSMGAPGGAELVGIAVTVSAGDLFTTNDRTFALSGISVSVLDGSTVTSYLAFPTGQELAVGQQGLGPRNAALSGASVSVVAGSVSAPEVITPGSELPGGGGPRKPHKRPKRHPGEEDPLVHRHPSEVSPTHSRNVVTEKIAEQLEKKKKPDDDEDEALLLL